jgi:hypothetical protein
LGYEVKEGKMEGACFMNGMINAYKAFAGNPEGRDHVETLV